MAKKPSVAPSERQWMEDVLKWALIIAFIVGSVIALYRLRYG
jgi:hypothetical protein